MSASGPLARTDGLLTESLDGELLVYDLNGDIAVHLNRTAAIVWREQAPQLQWVYIPHLDYDLQRFGPDSPQAKAAVRDAVAAPRPDRHPGAGGSGTGRCPAGS